MKFNQIIGLDEAKGSGSFDYKYWFWGKKGPINGIGYARQPIQLDIQKKGTEALDALDNIKNVIDTLEDEPDSDALEVVEKKIKANTKRMTGIVDLLSAPIIMMWLNNDPPSTVVIPKNKTGDVTDSGGRDIDVVGLFRDPSTQEFVTDVIDWSKVKINEKEGATLNTILAQFLTAVFAPGVSKKQARTYARGEGLESIMSNLRFKDKKGVEVVPFTDTDYKLFPAEMRGSKKMVPHTKKLIADNFAKVLKGARNAF